MQLVTPRPPTLRQQQKKLLVQAVQFAFRVHQFVGGDDEPTRRTFAQLDAMLAEVMGSSTAPDTASDAAVASLSAGEASANVAAPIKVWNGVAAAKGKTCSMAVTGEAGLGTAVVSKPIVAAATDTDDTQPVRD